MARPTKPDLPKLFISYAWENQTLAKQLQRVLDEAGAQLFIDYTEIKGGDKLPTRISKALQWCDTLVLLWSNEAADSHWVEAEWNSAFTLKRRLIPCMLDRTPLPEILTSLRYIEFTNFESGFEELLAALGLEAPSPTVTSKAIIDEMNLEQVQQLRELVSNWSDKSLSDARAFVRSCKELISSRDLANAQLHGFLNIVRNVKDVDDIKKFIQNQAMKAERAGKFKEKMHEFWQALQDRCEVIRADAAGIAREVNSLWANQPDRVAKIYQQLLQKYMQHVIAEKLLMEKSPQSFSKATK